MTDAHAATDPRAIQQAHELDVYGKRPLTLVRGEGARLFDDTGREFIDCISGHGVANLGHAHPAIVRALNEQASRLITLGNTFYNDQRAGLIQRLVDLSPPSLQRVFLCNSGAEAIEGAIKLARYTTGRTDFVCAARGFHGRTLGALSATFKPEYKQPFEPLVPGFSHAPFNKIDKFAARITDATAGIIVEPVLGEGGVIPGDPAFFQELRALCSERGALLIIDEIQTGFGRTGAVFAHERLGIEPDILCLAKALGGGLPIGAFVTTDTVKVPLGRHGTTFGGNPLCCAAANAAIDAMLAEDTPGQARTKGDALAARLRAANLPRVREVRQLGLMIGIELREKVQPWILKLLDRGVLVFAAGATVLRVYPPLVIEEPLLQRVGDTLLEVLSG